MGNEYLNNLSFEAIIVAFQSCKRSRARSEMTIRDLEETHTRRLTKYQDCKHEPPLLSQRTHHQNICVTFKDLQEQLAKAFYLLSENLANYYKYKYPFPGFDVDDAIQEGVLICFEKVDRFNPYYVGKNGDKTKAFNYMSTCIINHYRQIYRSVNNYNQLKKRYHDHLQEKFEKMFLRGHKCRISYRSSLDGPETVEVDY